MNAVPQWCEDAADEIAKIVPDEVNSLQVAAIIACHFAAHGLAAAQAERERMIEVCNDNAQQASVSASQSEQQRCRHITLECASEIESRAKMCSHAPSRSQFEYAAFVLRGCADRFTNKAIHDQLTKGPTR